MTGKHVETEQITMEQFEKELAAQGMPPYIVLDLSDSYKWITEFGCEHPSPIGLNIDSD